VTEDNMCKSALTHTHAAQVISSSTLPLLTVTHSFIHTIPYPIPSGRIEKETVIRYCVLGIGCEKTKECVYLIILPMLLRLVVRTSNVYCDAGILTQSADFDLNEAEKAGGNTALHVACAKGNAAITALLAAALRRYKQPLTVVNRQGYTPFAVACRCRHEACARILLEHPEVAREAQAIISAPQINVSDGDSSTADFVAMLLAADRADGQTPSSGGEGATSPIQQLDVSSSFASHHHQQQARLASPSHLSQSTSKLLSRRQRAPHTPSRQQHQPTATSSTIGFGSSQQLVRASDDTQSATVDKSIVNVKMLDAIRIRPASSKFPRNDPERIRVLNRDSITRCVEVPLQAGPAPSRLRSTKELDSSSRLAGGSTTGRMTTAGTTHHATLTADKLASAENWREFMQGLSDSLSYQFSQSYRPGVQLPALPSTTDDFPAGLDDDLDAADRASIAAKRAAAGAGGRRMSRLGSVISLRAYGGPGARHKK
jgi:hypothetical protein